MKKLILILLLLCFSEKLIKAQESNNLVSQSKLVEDTRYLAKILEESHPEPYQNFGGRIAFNRGLQEILLSIPAAGMVKSEYYNKIMPFVAKLCDMHTGLVNEEKASSNAAGLPLQLKIIEQYLVVTGVESDEYKSLLGAKLISIEGISLKELRIRQTRLRGIENEYGEFAFLTRSLKTSNGLKNLIPEWKTTEKISVEFKLKSGKKSNVNFQIGKLKTGNGISFDSKIIKPSTERSDVAFGFLDGKKETALLIVSNMERYREASEAWFSSGMQGAADYSGIAYKYFNKTDPPADKEKLLKGIPSATETFISLVKEINNARTKNLIIDLRENTGGNSLMKEMLVYFLFGKSGLLKINSGFQIKKYSDLYFNNFSSDSLAVINKNLSIMLTKNDYDFMDERGAKNLSSRNSEKLKEYDEYFKKSPTFWNVYKTGDYDNPNNKIKNIIILCSPFTVSSGFNMLTSLCDNGAKIVGVPSAQPGNNFGDVLFFQLPNTGIKGYVSFKLNVTFPDDPVKGKCLMPDYMLTYKIFAGMNFDPEAEIIWALELLKKN